MKLKVERLNHTGEGIAIKDKIYFIPKTVENDIIEPESIIEHKNYNEVTKYQLITPSEKRITISCPYYKYCGGCQLLQLNYQDQLIYKKEKVKNIFQKYTQIDINPQILPTNPYEYRNKITLQVKNNKLGLYQEKTNELVEIKKCLLIPDNLNHIIEILSKIDLTNINQIILKTFQNKVMIQIISNTDKINISNELKEKASSIYINNTLIHGKKYLEEELSNYKYIISPSSFFQINKEGTLLIYNKVKEYLGKSNNEVLDLYCGSSTIGIYVSKCCKHITGIEINSSSVKDAKENIKLNNVDNIDIIKGDVGTILKNDKKYDAIIIDPPRKGLNKKTLSVLLEINSPKLIYISCNPITLARDINILKNSYNLKEITLVDMFPNTYHVETVMVLEKKDV